MTLHTPTRLLFAGLLLLSAPLALAQHSGGGLVGGATQGLAGAAQGAQVGGQLPPVNRLTTGGNGGPLAGTRAANSGSAPTMRAATPFGLGSRWWDDHKTAKQLSLRREQQQRMDQIFDANRNTLASLYTNLTTEESRLRSLSAKDREDETKVFAAIDRVTQARAQLQKQSNLIVVQLHQQLDAPQIALMEQASR